MLYMLDTVKSVWILLGADGPGERASHGMFAHDGNLYVFGGQGYQSNYNDLWVFHASTRSWSQEYMDGTGPAPRHDHAFQLIDNTAVIFGGADNTGRWVSW